MSVLANYEPKSVFSYLRSSALFPADQATQTA